MVQALPTGEIKVCEELGYTRSSSNTGYIYTIDIEYSDELKQISIHSSLRKQKHV